MYFSIDSVMYILIIVNGMIDIIEYPAINKVIQVICPDKQNEQFNTFEKKYLYMDTSSKYLG
jgi:hypothetical protein